jgi:hypothetical protein
MEAIRSSETSVHTRSTRRLIPEDGILHSHCCENLKSYTRYHDSFVLCFLSLQTIVGIVRTSIRPQSLSSNFLAVRHSPVILQFDACLLTASSHVHRWESWNCYQVFVLITAGDITSSRLTFDTPRVLSLEVCLFVCLLRMASVIASFVTFGVNGMLSKLYDRFYVHVPSHVMI